MLVQTDSLALAKQGPAPGTVRLESWHDERVAPNRTHVMVGDVLTAPVMHIQLPPGWETPLARPQKAINIRLLHLNDLHGHILRLTPFGVRPVAARIAWYIDHVRRSRAAGEPEPLFLSAGDDSSGSVFDELIRSAAIGRQTHATYQVYSALGIDGAAVGNHDLDFGVSCLGQTARSDAAFPLLSANLQAQTLGDVVFPAAVLERSGFRIGVIGLTTASQIKAGSRLVTIGDPLLALRNLLPAFRSVCDVVILLSHLGLNRRSSAAAVFPLGDEDVASQLAPGAVDLIVGGHTHHALNEECLDAVNIVNGIPIVQAGANGRFLGEVVLTLEPGVTVAAGESFVRARPIVSVSDARLIPVADLPVDTAFEDRIVKPLYDRVRPTLGQQIGRTDMNHDLSSEGVRAGFDRGESALANFVTDALYEQCHASGYPVDLAMIDASILRQGVPVGGVLTAEDWHHVMPYSDSIQIFLLTGHEILALLMDNALRLGRAGEARIERGFAQFSRQLRYTIEAGASRRDHKISAAMLRGHDLWKLLDHRYYVGSHSHFRQSARAWEQQAWPHPNVAPIDPGVWQETGTNLFLRDEVVAYIISHGGITAGSGARHDRRITIVDQTSNHEHRSLFDQPALS